MKKTGLVIALLFTCIFLTACGGREDSDESTWKGIQAGMDDLSSITERTEYYDIAVGQESIFRWNPDRENSPLSIPKAAFIGMQLYQGEPVQLWAVPDLDQERMVQSWNVCLYGLDGSAEVVLQGVGYSPKYHGYLDQDGNFYWWVDSSVRTYPDGKTITTDTSIKKYLASGEVCFEKQLDPGQDITEICQTADGRLYLTIYDREAEAHWLAEMDPATGLITGFDAVSLLNAPVGSQDLGIWGNRLVMFKSHIVYGREIAEINPTDGSESCLLAFQGTSYISPEGFDLQDFRVLEDGSVEILWAARDGSESIREKLQMAKVEKTPIVLRGLNTEGWLTEQVNSFNQSSAAYHVIVEDCGAGNDADDFARLTSIQLASGKGPDILYGDLMQDYIYGMMEKGALEELHPYMEGSGICEEDYFPFTFDTWRYGSRIYSVSLASPGLAGYCMDSALLGGTEEVDIETLVDALAERSGDAVFLKKYDSQKLLGLLLKGTDTLWGMVDWEKRSCDFSGELFPRILETAKRYGDNDGGEKICVAQAREYLDIFLFDSLADRQKDGKVICGVLFDDGCHTAVASGSALAINANSPEKAGAWEFLAFLLGEKAQSAGNGVTASRKAFDIWVERQKEQVADGKKIDRTFATISPDGSMVVTGTMTFTEADITEEVIEEYIGMLEDARTCPIRTAPILDIISEEAADYFNGSKSAAEVAGIVANRVQTYLDEGR